MNEKRISGDVPDSPALEMLEEQIGAWNADGNEEDYEQYAASGDFSPTKPDQLVRVNGQLEDGRCPFAFIAVLEDEKDSLAFSAMLEDEHGPASEAESPGDGEASIDAGGDAANCEESFEEVNRHETDDESHESGIATASDVEILNDPEDPEDDEAFFDDGNASEDHHEAFEEPDAQEEEDTFHEPAVAPESCEEILDEVEILGDDEALIDAGGSAGDDEEVMGPVDPQGEAHGPDEPGVSREMDEGSFAALAGDPRFNDAYREFALTASSRSAPWRSVVVNASRKFGAFFGVLRESAHRLWLLARGPSRRPRLIWSVPLALVAILLGGLGFWFSYSGESRPVFNTSDAAVILASEIAYPAPTRTSDEPPNEDIGDRLQALSEDIEELKSQSQRVIADISLFREISSALPAQSELQQGAEKPKATIDAGTAHPGLDRFRSDLAGLDKRLTRLEQRGAAVFAGAGEAADAIVALSDRDSGMSRPPTAAEAVPSNRASLPVCGPEGRAVIQQMGELRMAAHEGENGQRWVRIIGEDWRGDLVEGERLPFVSAGAARVWIDEQGVFWVIELGGHQSCRLALVGSGSEVKG